MIKLHRCLFRKRFLWLYNATRVTLVSDEALCSRSDSPKAALYATNVRGDEKKIFCPFWLQNKVVSIVTEEDCWTVVLHPLGVNHISDKSIILPAAVSRLYETVQAQNECIRSIKKTWAFIWNVQKRCLTPIKAFKASGEVAKVHPEFKRMMNAAFLSLLGDIIMMRHINLYYSTTQSRTSKGNRNIALAENIHLHTPAYSL